jgi:predicted PhzF superfamily epimerase YddE/YHI9
MFADYYNVPEDLDTGSDNGCLTPSLIDAGEYADGAQAKVVMRTRSYLDSRRKDAL